MTVVLLGSVTALAAEEGAEPNLFAGGLANALVTLIIFGIVVLILSKAAWKPILKILNERERTIRDSIETARREREEAERLLSEYKAQLANAREEATAIVAEGRRDAEAVKQRLHEEARQEADELVQRARREIQLATDTAVKDLYDRTADVAVSLASSIIQKELTTRDHEQFVKESLAKMRESGGQRLN